MQVLRLCSLQLRAQNAASRYLRFAESLCHRSAVQKDSYKAPCVRRLYEEDPWAKVRNALERDGLCRSSSVIVYFDCGGKNTNKSREYPNLPLLKNISAVNLAAAYAAAA